MYAGLTVGGGALCGPGTPGVAGLPVRARRSAPAIIVRTTWPGIGPPARPAIVVAPATRLPHAARPILIQSLPAGPVARPAPTVGPHSRSHQNARQAIVARTRIVAGPAGVGPTTATVGAFHATRHARPAIVVRTTPAPGPVLVPRPLVVLQAHARRAARAIALGTGPLVVPRPTPTIVTARGGPARARPAIVVGPRPIATVSRPPAVLVRLRTRPVIAHPAIVIRSPAPGPMALPRPLVVPRSRPALVARGPIQPALRSKLPPAVLADPLPRPLVVPSHGPTARYRGGLLRTTPIVVQPPPPVPPVVNPPVPGTPSLPPDLMAAVVAWLRLDQAVVAALGETATSPRIFADLEARGTAAPWVSFSEPDEDESYETVDPTGRPSSVTAGLFHAEITGPGGSGGKLAIRQLAELIGDTIEDAPLTFADGTLIYLRRTGRKFPIFREPGTGGTAQFYKRILEFEYMIERWL